jgi:radical SAM superfamily enzyme YgiQ (UPF0313 family)
LIIFGGVHASFCYEDLLLKEPSSIDFIIRGEGELTLLELLKELSLEENNFHKIKGLVFLDKFNNQIVVTEKRSFITDLDSLPLPARDLLPMREYLHGETIFGNPMIEVMASRGCPQECIFCSSPKFWERRTRFRSVENVIDEIIFLKNHYTIKYVAFVDDGFTLRKDFIYQFCEEVIKRKIVFKWRCLARVDHVNREMLGLLKKAGCVKICYGVESGNQKILDFEKKRTSIEQIKKAFSLTHEVGIATLALMIIGHPYETEETILESINLIREISPFRFVFQCMSPYVGTELYENIASATGIILSNKWEDFRSTEAPMFIPHGLTKQTLIKYHDEFMQENNSLFNVLKRIFLAFLLVKLDVFNKKFFLKPIYYSSRRYVPETFNKAFDSVLFNIIIPAIKKFRVLKLKLMLHSKVRI